MGARGRPRQFDRQDVLSQATRLFWANGFRSTSVEDLLNEMGINRGSMYATFGDKRSLFIEAVHHYIKTSVQDLAAMLSRRESAREDLRETMRFVANLDKNKDRTGCLLTHTAIEIAENDHELSQLVRDGLAASSKQFELAIQRGMDSGEFKNVRSASATAAYILTSCQGLNVLSRAGYSVEYIQNVIDHTLALLD